MKKILIVLLCFFISVPLTHASFFKMGPRVGTSVSQIKMSPAPGNTALADLQPGNYWGYHMGAFTRFNLLLCHIQPEILLTSTGARCKKNDKIFELSCTKLAIPAMVGLSFFSVFRIQLGPVFSWLLCAKEGRKNVREHYKSMTIGWQAGLGIDIWKIGIDLKYDGSLSKFGNKIAGISTNDSYAQWILSVGFNII